MAAPLVDQRFVTGTVSSAAQKNIGMGDVGLASSSGYATHGIALAAAPKSVAKPYGPAPDNVALQVMGLAAVTVENDLPRGLYQDGFAAGFTPNRLGTTVGKHQTLLHPMVSHFAQSDSATLVYFQDGPAGPPRKQPVTEKYHPRDVYNTATGNQLALDTITRSTAYTSSKVVKAGSKVVKLGIQIKSMCTSAVPRIHSTTSVTKYLDGDHNSTQALAAFIDQKKNAVGVSIGSVTETALIKYYKFNGDAQIDTTTKYANDNVVGLSVDVTSQTIKTTSPFGIDAGTASTLKIIARQVGDNWLFYGATEAALLCFYTAELTTRSIL